jgi:hypothetical protein
MVYLLKAKFPDIILFWIHKKIKVIEDINVELGAKCKLIFILDLDYKGKIKG